jgi:hypothetical protein
MLVVNQTNNKVTMYHSRKRQRIDAAAAAAGASGKEDGEGEVSDNRPEGPTALCAATMSGSRRGLQDLCMEFDSI